MAKGGKREGAGRKVGSTTRPVLRNYMTPEEIEKFMNNLLKDAETDVVLRKFVAEQLLGKAMQAVELTGANGKDLFGNDETRNKTKKAVGSFLKGDGTAGDRKDT